MTRMEQPSPTGHVSARSPRTSRNPAFILLTAFLLLMPCAGITDQAGNGMDEADQAEMFPLASKSMLLDLVKTGNRLVAVGERGHILVSDDGGAGWKQVPVPTRSMLNAAEAVPGGLVWAVGHDAVILHSADRGTTWQRQYYAPEEERPLLDVWFENKSHGVAVGAYGLLLETTDGGKTWDQRKVDEEERHWNAITEADDGTLYVAAEFGVVFRSRDKAGTWEELATPYQGTYFGIRALSDGSVLVFGLRGHVYRSGDQGDTWKQIKTGTFASLLNALQLTDGTVIIVGLSGTVLLSEDMGQSFRPANLPDRLGIASALEPAPGRLLLCGEGGVHPGDSVLGKKVSLLTTSVGGL